MRTPGRFLLGWLGIWVLLVSGVPGMGQESQPGNSKMNSRTFAGLKLRAIGPAVMSGRISDIAIDPEDRSVWYVAAASGNVWKTENRGTTWKPIFDNYPSYSIGCITLEPGNSKIVWLGTGENNSQRSVGYGDGVYKSLDGGRSWKNVGLRASEHIGKILVDPEDANTVYVASQGPLWAPGGDRGLYKTIDGGENWELILEISENTGISDIAFDPRDSSVIYASSYQRRRHVGILIAGGPESALYKTSDSGKSWKKLTRGLPRSDVGRIGLAVSPIQPDIVYATIPAARGEGGFYRSSDRGESWEKRSDYVPADPQYYQEIFADPHQFDRVYCMDIQMRVTEDGGSTFRAVNSEFKHVDNHALIFDPKDPDYLLIGCDGGLYETWDQARTWSYFANLPITQFYRVGLDNDFPFYNVYGGTQDNATQGGPSRTNNVHGIRNSDWFNTVGGDGFQARIDPEDPNIVYSMSQYAGIVRYDRKSGERIEIQPQPDEGEAPLRWHWDAPLIISPHSPTRLYFAANRLFRSEDRGDTWTAVSPDLTRKIDRNQREVMGRVWSVDAVWKNVYTSPLGAIISLDESPQMEGLIYAGTDDGIVQVTEDGGQNWRQIKSFPGIPEQTYVADVHTSRHDADTVFVVFNNHKEGDFNPYLLKSEDRGRSWESITGDLPEGQLAWTVYQDHQRPDLLFAGTEFGLFFSVDGGKHWVQLKGNVPTIPFRDLEIQRRENDLVGASFGRGFFILDDYTPLRHVNEGTLTQEAVLFPVKDPWMYIEAGPLGRSEKGQQGNAYFTAPNPPFGATFTYYLKDALKSKQQQRWEKEDRQKESGETIQYPSWEELRTEDREQPSSVLLTIRDEAGAVVRRLEGPTGAGFHRVSWDLRYPGSRPVSGSQGRRRSSSGPMVVPGKYTVTISTEIDGQVTPMGEEQAFQTVPLGTVSLPAEDRQALLDFQHRVGRLQRAVLAAEAVTEDTLLRLNLMKRAIADTPAADVALLERARKLELQLLDLQVELSGDETVSSRFEATTPSISERVQRIIGAQWSSTSAPTTTHRHSYEVASRKFQSTLKELRDLVEQDLKALDEEMETAGAPWTPGRRLPDWQP